MGSTAGIQPPVRGGNADLRTGRGSLPHSLFQGLFSSPRGHPLIRSTTLISLSRVATPERILSPTFEGTRGHPPLIGTEHIPALLTCTARGGLREFLGKRERWTLEIPVADQGILLDMDTPEEYEELRRRAASLHVPNRAERRALFALAGTPEPVIRHCAMVTSVAVRLAMELRALRPDLPVLRAASLLHDICKTEANHDAASGRFLEEQGFPEIGAVVATHMNLPSPFSSEQALLYLADKMVDGTRLISLDEKKELMRARFANAPSSWRGARRRLARARRIARAVERITGRGMHHTVPPPSRLTAVTPEEATRGHSRH